jgi:hypothetical protein
VIRTLGPRIGAVLLGLAIPLGAAEPWSKTDWAMETAYFGLTLVDWGQTLNLPHGMSESNVVMGRHPERSTINTYFATCLILHPLITNLLPRPARTIWQAVTVGIEIDTVARNYRFGIKCRF